MHVSRNGGPWIRARGWVRGRTSWIGLEDGQVEGLVRHSSQKSHCQGVYSDKKPPTVGAITGPRKLAAENKASGTDRWLYAQISVREPPEFVTVGAPKKPTRKRSTNIAAMLGPKHNQSVREEITVW